MPESEVRSDLIVHLIVFGGLMVMVTMARLFGPRFGLRNIALSAVVSAIYAAIDESTQAIPALRRFAAWDDYLANLLGIGLSAVVLILLGVWYRRRFVHGTSGDEVHATQPKKSA